MCPITKHRISYSEIILAALPLKEILFYFYVHCENQVKGCANEATLEKIITHIKD